MRLAEIAAARTRMSNAVQPLPEGDFSHSVGVSFALREKERTSRALKRLLARPALAMQRASVRRALGFDLLFVADAVGIGERYVEEAAWARMLRQLPPIREVHVLVPGCYMAGGHPILVAPWREEARGHRCVCADQALGDDPAGAASALGRARCLPPGSIEDIPLRTDH
jgi:hypothetical protein